MAGGGRIQITDRDGREFSAVARVSNGRLHVTLVGSSSDVNIGEIGGHPVAGPNLPVDIGNVTIGNESSDDLDELSVRDVTGNDLLASILTELKLHTLYLQSISDEEFDHTDLIEDPTE